MTDNKINPIFQFYQKQNEEWAKFQEITKKNLESVEKSIETSQEKCQRYESTIDNVKELSKYAQHKSYVKVCSLAYVEAFVKHTGEYNVNLGSDYQATLTKDQTVEYLDEQLAAERCNLNTFKVEREQLERRLGYDFTEVDDFPDISDMPERILSDKGMAVKNGNFFEVIEEDNTPVNVKGKRISRVKKVNGEDVKVTRSIDELKLDDIEDVNQRAEAFLDFIEK